MLCSILNWADLLWANHWEFFHRSFCITQPRAVPVWLAIAEFWICNCLLQIRPPNKKSASTQAFCVLFFKLFLAKRLLSNEYRLVSFPPFCISNLISIAIKFGYLASNSMHNWAPTLWPINPYGMSNESPLHELSNDVSYLTYVSVRQVQEKSLQSKSNVR